MRWSESIPDDPEQIVYIDSVSMPVTLLTNFLYHVTIKEHDGHAQAWIEATPTQILQSMPVALAMTELNTGGLDGP
jgi:hypothetical protein